jgi:hypothetical protein
MQKAKVLQQNRAQYFVKMRAHQQKPTPRPTVLSTNRTTIVQGTPVPMGILVAQAVAVPANGRPLPVAPVVGPDKS